MSKGFVFCSFMTYLHQIEDLFGKRSWWDDTWANSIADWTVKPVINKVERVGVGLSMSVATMASEKVLRPPVGLDR